MRRGDYTAFVTKVAGYENGLDDGRWAAECELMAADKNRSALPRAPPRPNRRQGFFSLCSRLGRVGCCLPAQEG